MEITYRHSYNNNLMVIKDSNVIINDYRINMITRNNINGLLEMYVGCINGETEISYVISSKQCIREIFQKNKIQYEDLKILLDSIIGIAKELKEYLLDINHILIESDNIFFDVDTKKVYFCYYPNKEQTFKDSFKNILQEMAVMIEHNDYKAVELIYGIMEICNKTNFSMIQIEDYIKTVCKDDTNEIYKEIKEVRNDKVSVNKYDEEKLYLSDVNKKNTYGTDYKDEFDYMQTQVNKKNEADNDIKNYRKMKYSFTKFMKSLIIKKQKEIYDEDYGLTKENYNFENENTDDISEDIYRMKKIKSDLSEEDEDCDIYNMNIDNECNDSETVLITDIIKDKKRKLFSLCDYDDILINEYPFIIGKSAGKVDEVIEDRLVSRIHLRINNELNKFTIEDLNSRNGTFVNGERLNPYEKVEITIGDKITIASSEYIFK